MPTRLARTRWNGGLADGSGRVDLASSELGSFNVSFPTRAAEEPAGITSPEELLAAAHSSCFAMQLSALLTEAGGSVGALDVAAHVSLGPDPQGGFKLTDISLTVEGDVAGIDEQTFKRAADEAKATCPVSKGLTGVDIMLTASLRQPS